MSRVTVITLYLSAAGSEAISIFQLLADHVPAAIYCQLNAILTLLCLIAVREGKMH
jgi:hypothetical protein